MVCWVSVLVVFVWVLHVVWRMGHSYVHVFITPEVFIKFITCIAEYAVNTLGNGDVIP